MTATDLRDAALAHIRERGTLRSDVLGRLLEVRPARVAELLADLVKAGALIACDVHVHGGPALKEYRVPAGKMPEFTPRRGLSPMRFGARPDAPAPAADQPAPQKPAAIARRSAPRAGRPGIEVGAIEKGVPIPQRNAGRVGPIAAALRELGVGDSFTTSATANGVRAIATQHGVKIATRAEPSQAGDPKPRIRVWRIA